jgi:hypothetical protein
MWVLDVETRRWRRMETFIDWWPHTPILAASADTIYATADLQATWQLPVGAKEVFGWSCDKGAVAVSTEAAIGGNGRQRASPGSPTTAKPTFVPRTRLDTSGLPAGHGAHPDVLRSPAPPVQTAPTKTPVRGGSPVPAIGSSVQRQLEAEGAGIPAPSMHAMPHRPSRSSSAPWATAFAGVTLEGVHAGADPEQSPSRQGAPPRQFHSSTAAAVIADDRGEHVAEHDRLAAATFAPVADDAPADPLELLPSMRRPARRLVQQPEGA